MKHLSLKHATCSGIAIAFLLCNPSAQAFQRPQMFSPPQQAKGYSLAFDDEFSTPDLSPNGLGLYTWYPGIWFNHTHPLMSNFQETDGRLTLSWTANQASGDTSVETLSSDKLHYSAFRYGYFEVNMKWDPVTGSWPSFWMIPVQVNSVDGVTDSGELDIFEGNGSQPHTFFGTIHEWVDNKDHYQNKVNYYALPTTNDFSKFHTYGALWEPGKVTWYYDNQPLHSEPTPAIFDQQDYFLVLSMIEGANWKEGDRTGVTADKLTLTVNWVRVWQQ